MKLNQITTLIEARRNPHLNSKISSVQKLKDLYKNDSDPSSLFVTFTNINKLGINPSSEFSTPNGIYCYRLSYIVDKSEWASLLTSRPFPDNLVENVIVFRLINNSNVFNVKDKILPNHLNTIINLSQSDERYQSIFSTIIKNNKGTYGGIWKAVYKYIKSKKHFDKHTPRELKRPDSGAEYSLEARFALTIFRSLGIDGFIDDGTETIHENEPNQAVFFNKGILRIIDHLKDENPIKFKRSDLPLDTKEQVEEFANQMFSYSLIVP